MKRSRFTQEQIIGVLKEHQAGATAADLCRRHGISEATFYTWRSKYGGINAAFIVVAPEWQASSSTSTPAVLGEVVPTDKPTEEHLRKDAERSGALWTVPLEARTDQRSEGAMSDVTGNDQDDKSEKKDLEERENFLNYNYREPIELAKQSVGIVSGILLLSVNFSDKLGGIQNSPPSYKYILLGSWAFLLMSITFCGLSMAFSWNSARYMLWGQNEVRPPRRSRRLSRFAANALTSAGIFFVLGLALMIAGGFMSSVVRPG